MREAYSLHPQDLDIRTIFVDAIMNRTPWKMWDLETGKVAEGADTLEARDVLETAFNRIAGAIDHPGLLHLYVHLMEMSPFPERALRVADKLRELVPDAGHLIHMPTHIDMLCGNYHDVLHWNQKAIAVDRKYLERAGPVKFYTGYRIHNYRFAIYGSMFLGQYEPALAAAEELIATTPEKLLRMPSPPMADMLEGYISVKQHVLVRFGKWREIIAEALPDDNELYCNTFVTIIYAKGVAHAALGEISEAEKEQERFRVARNRVPLTRRIHNNSCQDLLGIAEEMLAGEIEYRKGNYDVAFAHLRKAVELDDSLPYDEPWGWMQPTRHALGALLLEQGLTDEAEVVYREDLGIGGRLSRAQIHPDNLWSLQGLFDCLVRRGEKAESRLIRQRLELAAARADVQVRVSCFCARGKVTSSD
jgi:tetratricopeptide (TPR) repeat protein